MQLRRKQQDEIPAAHPRIDDRVREEWRYQGMGMTADDGLADFLANPDQIDEETISSLLDRAKRQMQASNSIRTEHARAEQAPRATPDTRAQRSTRTMPADSPAPRINSKIGDAATPMRCDASRFSRMYESRDGRLCVFEDECGHLVAVNTQRLA